MKRLFALLFMACVSIIMIAQPIKTGPVKSLFEGYNPQQPAILNKAVPGPRGPKGNDGKLVITVIDTSTSIIIPSYMTRDEVDYLLNLNFTQTFNQIDSLHEVWYMTNNRINNVIYDLSNLNTALTVKHYKDKAKFKILSGIGLQTIAVGLIAYANIDRYEFENTITHTNLEYVYNDFALTNIPGKAIRDHCGNITGYTPTTYQLVPIVAHGVINTSSPKQTVIARARNKTAYYTVAGILGVIGTAFEISGIIDTKHVNMYINNNGIGTRVQF